MRDITFIKMELGRDMKTKKTNFLKEIEYTEFLCDMVYVKDKSLLDKKLYSDDTFEISEAKTDLLSNHKKFPPSIRKAVFNKEIGKGIIIGQKVKKEGHYSPTVGGSSVWGYEDYEPAYLAVTKTIKLWVVATDMNRTILVEK